MSVVGLLVLTLVVVAQVVKVNLDNRSKADEIDSSDTTFKMTDTVSGVYQTSQNEEEIADENMCGEADSESVTSRPTEKLCKKGMPVWVDSVANDGMYKWNCVEDTTGKLSECSALLKK